MNDRLSLRGNTGWLGLRAPLRLLFVLLASLVLCGVALAQNYTLSIQSTPITGVPVTATPTDVNGNANGNTNYTLTYASGTSVKLQAALALGNYRFVYWVLDGAQETLGEPDLTVLMNGNHTAVATYVPEFQLTIESEFPNSGIAVTAPPDVDGNGNGTTTFDRFYSPGSSVTITAPATAPNGNAFAYWVVDSVQQTAGQTSLTLTMSAVHVAVAVYQTFNLSVQSQNPNSGVSIVANCSPFFT